jgi:LPXTG-motif cell wall-anchored protein
MTTLPNTGGPVAFVGVLGVLLLLAGGGLLLISRRRRGRQA